MWWTVIVMGKELHELEAAYGPYRSRDAADRLARLLTDPYAVDYHDPDEYEIYVAPVRKYADA